MNALFRHIEFLLTNHDCVIVPGLGAFIVTSLPAVIDRVSRRITPPSRSVMFNQAVTVDDGLLANSYARRLGLSFEEARQIILKDVALLLDTLNASARCDAGRLGTFSLGEENQLVFTPAFSPIDFAERNGLYAFSQPSNQEVSNSASGAEIPQSPASLVNNSEETIKDKEQEKRYFQFRINRSVIRFTAAFTLVAAIALAVLMYPVPHDIREHRASVMPVEALIPVQSPKEQPASTPEPRLLPAENIQESEPTIETPVHKPAAEHFLIVATFHSKKEAERYVQIHSTAEFPLETVSSRKVTRVYAASSSDRQELLSTLNSPKILKNFPNAWIWSAGN